MTVRYVRKSGNDGNSGLDKTDAKLTFNGMEDTPVVAGDTIHVGAGTYRELLTCDVSGSAGNPITYMGDYTGEYTGDAGVVRITGSDDDITTIRGNAIYGLSKDYRTFQGFAGDTTSSVIFRFDDCDNLILDRLHVGGERYPVYMSNPGTSIEIRNSYFSAYKLLAAITLTHGATLDDRNMTIENCILTGYGGFNTTRCGGVLIRNTDIIGVYRGIEVAMALTVGQEIVVNNCVLSGNGARGMVATVLGEIIEDYNSFYGFSTDRENVAVGANSNTYPPLFDSRWFFEQAINNRKLVTPFDLSEHSQLINVAGTSPTTTDLRGMSVQGAQREWGALEYYAALSKGDGISRGRLV